MIWVMSPAIMVPGSPLGSEYGTAAAAVAEAIGTMVVVSVGMSDGAISDTGAQLFCDRGDRFFLRSQNKKAPGFAGGHPLGTLTLGLLSSIALSFKVERKMPRLGGRGKSFLRLPTGFFLAWRIESRKTRQRNPSNFSSVKPNSTCIDRNR